ncbi:hypothetical protein Zmor_013101 [Zophobas morio]|uniref:Uncharacterized protein n=1 Tax=Zophobas morio TaxID=2755281 RepID=A0AA38HSS2_9CUCU|nr:hypothetical protein Zmor_025081 [Zophobas morio]KAJ3653872.1 hypothetical protein Zmor_013101 [Zophobas morio]
MRYNEGGLTHILGYLSHRRPFVDGSEAVFGYRNFASRPTSRSKPLARRVPRILTSRSHRHAHTPATAITFRQNSRTGAYSQQKEELATSARKVGSLHRRKFESVVIGGKNYFIPSVRRETDCISSDSAARSRQAMNPRRWGAEARAHWSQTDHCTSAIS